MDKKYRILIAIIVIVVLIFAIYLIYINVSSFDAKPRLPNPTMIFNKQKNDIGRLKDEIMERQAKNLVN